MRPTLRGTSVAAIAALTAVTAAACSSSSSGSGSGSGAGATGNAPSKIVIALVPSQNADTIMGTSKPMTDYLTSKVGVPVSAVVTQDYAGAVTAIGSNQAQAAFLPVLPMEQAVDKFGASPLLQVVRSGKTTYHTQFFTNTPSKFCADTPAPAGTAGYLYCNGTGGKKDGPAALDALPKMKGSQVAFVEQTSASGYIFPMLDMLKAGMTKSDVTPIFAGGHDKAVLAVYNGQAPVGTSFDDARANVKDKPDVGQKVVVFALSEEIPNDGVVMAKGVDQATAAKFSQALIDYSGTDDGKKTLNSLYGITSFAKADPNSLAIVKEAAAKVVGS